MPEFKPFRGVRYSVSRTGTDLSGVICPPYDLISASDQDSYYKLDAHNAVRIDFGKVLPGDNEQENRYTRAAALFREWLSAGILVQDSEPAYYLLEEHFEDDRGQELLRHGVIGLKHLEENRPGTSVRPHEATYAGPKQDRFELMKAAEANLSPVFGVYQDPAFRLEKIFLNELPRDRFLDARGWDGVNRRLFVVSHPHTVSRIEELFHDMPLLIADGHHRYETSLAYRDWRRIRDPQPGKEQPYDYTLMYLANLESAGVCVYPTHRLIKNVSGLDSKGFFSTLRELFEVKELGSAASPSAGEELTCGLAETPAGAVRFGCCFKEPDRCCLITARDPEALGHLFPSDTAPMLRSLDVSILHQIILGKCLGIPREEQTRGEVLEYAKGIQVTLDLLVQRADLRGAFLLNPPDLRRIMKIAFAGLVMPQKTTYFFPKVPTGLVFRKM